jgi:hypothetical protein
VRAGLVVSTNEKSRAAAPAVSGTVRNPLRGFQLKTLHLLADGDTALIPAVHDQAAVRNAATEDPRVIGRPSSAHND